MATGNETTTKTEATDLQLLNAADPNQIKNELQLKNPQDIQITADANLDQQASTIADQLLNFDPNQVDGLDGSEKSKASIETMGVELQKKAAQLSEMLKQPVRKMSSQTEDGGPVANALIDLKIQVEGLDPAKFNFENGWMSRTLGKLPGVGTPLKRYFSKFESAQTVINAIVKSLENGRDQLVRDNTMMVEDQKRMREMTIKLDKAIQLGMMIDQKLQYKLQREIPQTNPQHNFVKEELLFPLKQRIMDLQQQLAVNQQGVLAIEVIIRNNKELARGVARALNVTVTALQVGATVALALANQKIVLDKVEAVNKTTSDLISGTAERLKTQGVQIQKQAVNAQIDMNSLKKAFQDINSAMEDLSKFRNEALPQMSSTIGDLDRLTKAANQSIEKMEKSNQAKPSIKGL